MGEPTMRAVIIGGAFATGLVLLALALHHGAPEQDVETVAAASPAITPPTTPAAAETGQGFLYGRITTLDGAAYEGRLRWGIGEEAFWGDYFNGFKDENPWAAHVPLERQPKLRRPIKILGIEIGSRKVQNALGRSFMARFGDIARIAA